ncbi:unnamed protein product [Schistocephalus solidus]|uniref:Uncharacterized protein n=1 Tax=Schistocephalus solidus TaxID=70667 RepID=A0A183SGV4_SCHSO|nr:unnamed protein product [Schistocephalus solidus]
MRGHKTQTNSNTPHPHSPLHTLQAFLSSPLILAAWEVHSPYEDPRSNQLERKLARYQEDVFALSETRFSDQSQLEEVQRPPKGIAM